MDLALNIQCVTKNTDWKNLVWQFFIKQDRNCLENVMYTKCLTGFVLIAGLALPAHALAQTIGTTTRADATVFSGAKVLRTGNPISANQRIRVNATGLGHFKFNDGTKMVIGPGARMVLDETIYRPGGSTFKKFAIDTTRGALRFISGSSAAAAYEIETPTGTLGIRGTAFDMQHLRGRTYIMLVNGMVTFCTRAGSCETIRRKCDFVVAQPGGRISAPVQPRDGIYSKADMERYFPFMFDQSQIEPEFRLGVNTCAGGNSSATGNGPDSGAGDGEGFGGLGGDISGGRGGRGGDF